MESNESGFSLIELLVAVGILGILAATAISQYNSYKTRAFNARAVSDLRNIISAQEAQFIDNESFVTDIALLTGFDATSPSVTAVLSADATSWQGSSYHPLGTKTYCYDSSNTDGIVDLDGLNQACP